MSRNCSDWRKATESGMALMVLWYSTSLSMESNPVHSDGSSVSRFRERSAKEKRCDI